MCARVWAELVRLAKPLACCFCYCWPAGPGSRVAWLTEQALKRAYGGLSSSCARAMMDDWEPLESDDECGDLGRLAIVGGVPVQESQLDLPSAPRSSVGGVPQPESQLLLKHTSESTVSCLTPATAAVPGDLPPIVHHRTRHGRSSRAVRDLAASLRRKASARPTGRKLARRVSSTKPEEAKAISMICIWGGVVKSPVVVKPVWTENGMTWMSPNEHWQWLRRACCPRGLTHYKELFQSAVSALRRELQNGVKLADEPDAAGALRAALALESDDANDDDGQTNRRSKAACPPRARRHAAPPKVVDVTVGDVTMKVQNQLRPLRVECTEASVNAVITFCRKHVLDGKADLKKYRAHEDGGRRSAFVMPTDDCPLIVGRVTWQPSHRAWCVHGKDGSGATFGTRIRVTTPHQLAGVVSSFFQSDQRRRGTDAKEAYTIERRSRYIEAIETWNEKDKSTRDRLVVPAA